jgi:hypothetical protein
MRKNPRRILSPQRLPFRHPGRAAKEKVAWTACMLQAHHPGDNTSGKNETPTLAKTSQQANSPSGSYQLKKLQLLTSTPRRDSFALLFNRSGISEDVACESAMRSCAAPGQPLKARRANAFVLS